MLWLVVLAAAAPVKLASPGLSLVGVDAARGSYFSEKLAASMVSDQLNVITPKEMAALIGLERQKQLMGCADASSSCIAELGAALGVDGLLLGDLALIGKRFEVTAKVVSSNDGKLLAIRTGQAASEEELSDLLVGLGAQLAAELLPKLGRTVPAKLAALNVESQSAGSIRGARRFFWIPLVVGALSGLGSLLLLSQAEERVKPLREGNRVVPLDEATALAGAANGFRTGSLITTLVMGACFVATLGLAIFGGPQDASAAVSAWATGEGGGLAISGGLP